VSSATSRFSHRSAKSDCIIDYNGVSDNGHPARDIRISDQFLITRALHFAQLALETFKLYSATQCDSDACLIIRLWLCKLESTSNQKLVVNSNIAPTPPFYPISSQLYTRRSTTVVSAVVHCRTEFNNQLHFYTDDSLRGHASKISTELHPVLEAN